MISVHERFQSKNRMHLNGSIGMNRQNCDVKKCKLLKEANDRLNSYQLCAEKSLQDLSALNTLYEQRVNELSTIINIFEYINSVKDYKNLFSIINDMLLGVLGASTCTIFTYQGDGYRVEVSSLPRKKAPVMDSVGNVLFEKYLQRKEAFIITESEFREDFNVRDGINSAVAVPLAGKKEMFGIIYMEHTKKDYFLEERCRYLNTLAIAIRLSLENARLYSRLEEMAYFDGLTGLYNRMFFNKEIDNCMGNLKKLGLPFTLAILDLDHFKNVNDTYGHLCGDIVLKRVADIVMNEVRREDLVCRCGGEEFAIVFRNTRDTESIYNRLEHIRKKISEAVVRYQDSEISVTCSFGAVSCTLNCKKNSSEDVMRAADEALYRAKGEGRNRVCMIIS